MLIVTERVSGRSVSVLSELDKGLMAEINSSEMGKSTLPSTKVNCFTNFKAHFIKSVRRKSATIYLVLKRLISFIFHFKTVEISLLGFELTM